ERAENVGKTIRSRWEHVAEDVPEVGEIRGLGAMIGVEFVADRESRAPAGEFTGALVSEAMSHGVVPVTCGPYHNVLRHLVPLVITDDQLDEGLDVLADSAAAASKRMRG